VGAAQAVRCARCAILNSFLERAAIYHFPSLRERYETKARENLAGAITALQAFVT
jgi:predicted metal-dependent HD superfamily phosphohydrolase